jgi:hypothetical protein
VRSVCWRLLCSIGQLQHLSTQLHLDKLQAMAPGMISSSTASSSAISEPAELLPVVHKAYMNGLPSTPQRPAVAGVPRVPSALVFDIEVRDSTPNSRGSVMVEARGCHASRVTSPATTVLELGTMLLLLSSFFVHSQLEEPSTRAGEFGRHDTAAGLDDLRRWLLPQSSGEAQVRRPSNHRLRRTPKVPRRALG